MCFFWKRKQKNKETNNTVQPTASKKDLLEAECVSFCQELDVAIGEANSYFANPDIYIEIGTADYWVSKYYHLLVKSDKNTVQNR